MSDKNKKSDDDVKAEKVEKKETSSDKKEKVIEKLQAMGVMSDGGDTDSNINPASEKGDFLKLSIVTLAAVMLVGSFVWALNKESKNQSTVSIDRSINTAIPHSNNPNRNTEYNRLAEREKYQKWMQQQHQMRQQQVVQQRKWAQQQRQAQMQQRAQQQKWMQEQQQAQRQQYEQKRKWAQQSYSSNPHNMNSQRRPMPQPYNRTPGYQQPNPYYQR